jgi:hypothetical protein
MTGAAAHKFGLLLLLLLQVTQAWALPLAWATPACALPSQAGPHQVDPLGRDPPVARLVWVDPLTEAWGDLLARDPPVGPLCSSDRTAAAAAVAAAYGCIRAGLGGLCCWL